MRIGFCGLLALATASTAGSLGCTRIRTLAESRGLGTPEPAPIAAPAAPPSATPPPPPGAPTLPGGARVAAFPGAEGFGAGAKGGRGGSVCRVTTLARSGAGSLQACFDARGARTVVFDVSGVIEGPLEIKHGQLTVAGQTSASGIVIKGGVVCDNVYDPNDCNDVIVRHVRFRGGAPDSFRIGGAHDVILDHCSFATADDENIEINRSRNVTIQHAVIAEPKGDHYRWGGVLINYSTDRTPLDAITIHHSVWNGVAGRLPEISCEENGDGAGKSNCSGRAIAIELSNNVLWDASDPIWFNRCTGTNEGNDCPPAATNFGVRMNLVGNVLVRRSSSDPDLPFVEPALFASPRSEAHVSDNLLVRGAASRVVPPGARPAARHAFPPVSYTPAAALVATLARSAGAFPRDRMDTRLASYLLAPIDRRPPAWRGDQGLDAGDAFAISTSLGRPVESADGDGDGMPDAWEKAHGLDPRVADGAAFGRARGCAAGYSALECYLNELADARTGR